MIKRPMREHSHTWGKNDLISALDGHIADKILQIYLAWHAAGQPVVLQPRHLHQR